MPLLPPTPELEYEICRNIMSSTSSALIHNLWLYITEREPQMQDKSRFSRFIKSIYSSLHHAHIDIGNSLDDIPRLCYVFVSLIDGTIRDFSYVVHLCQLFSFVHILCFAQVLVQAVFFVYKFIELRRTFAPKSTFPKTRPRTIIPNRL